MIRKGLTHFVMSASGKLSHGFVFGIFKKIFFGSINWAKTRTFWHLFLSLVISISGLSGLGKMAISNETRLIMH